MNDFGSFCQIYIWISKIQDIYRSRFLKDFAFRGFKKLGLDHVRKRLMWEKERQSSKRKWELSLTGHLVSEFIEKLCMIFLGVKKVFISFEKEEHKGMKILFFLSNDCALKYYLEMTTLRTHHNNPGSFPTPKNTL